MIECVIVLANITEDQIKDHIDRFQCYMDYEELKKDLLNDYKNLKEYKKQKLKEMANREEEVKYQLKKSKSKTEEEKKADKEK